MKRPIKLVITFFCLALTLLLLNCSNPCKELADKTCKIKGKNSRACKNAQEQLKKAVTSDQKRECKIGLELVNEMEEKMKTR
jgi:hypothetical protein